jgi:nucleoid-associated protein YgaU
MQPPGVPVQRLPQVRYYTVQGGESLAALAQNFYGNDREAVRIFNANRQGSLRADKTPGFLRSTNTPLEVGMILLVP